MAAPMGAQTKPVRLGLIGCGWYGGVDLDAAYKVGGVQCTAICDVDQAHLDEFTAKVEKADGRKPAVYRNYRDMLARREFDALIIATPPHWHALPFIAAMENKIPTYMEKPLAYDVRECQAMVAAWKKAGVPVQVGFQRRQGDTFRAVREFVAAGHAGRIVQVDAQIHYQAATPDPKPQAPPAGWDWDAWCGPSPLQPYSPAIGHRSWRLEHHTGHGHLVDWGIHLIDATRLMLGESVPQKVRAMGGIYQYKGLITTPDTLTAQFDFARCPVVWRHRLWGARENDPATANGVFLYGDKATVFVNDGVWRVMPREKGAPIEEKKAAVAGGAMGVAHMREFIEALRGGAAPSCTVEDAARSTTTVILGMIAYESNAPVVWDAAAARIPDHPAAAKLLKREYRRGYAHPFAG